MGTLLFIMKFLGFLIFIISVSAEWTCDDCEVAGHALGEATTTEEAIEWQTLLLVAEFCPEADDPAACEQQLPPFWTALVKIIYPESFEHMCDDIEECTDHTHPTHHGHTTHPHTSHPYSTHPPH